MPDDSLVITSADIANSRRYLTAAIRVRSMKDTVDPGGVRRFQFWYQSNPETRWLLEARVAGGKTEAVTLWTATAPDGTGTFSLHRVGSGTAVIDRDELRISVLMSVASLHAGKRPATRLTDLEARVERMVGVSRDSVPAVVPYTAVAPPFAEYSVHGGDNVAYVLNTPSCVAVGR